MMRKSSLLIVLIVVGLFVGREAIAADYYFSDQIGNDARSAQQAQRPDTPWKSIAKLNQIMGQLRPGDRVLFRRGEVFTGTINLSNSGSSGIYYGAYGNGLLPQISGLYSLRQWRNHGNGIFYVDLPQLPEGGANLLLINGNSQEMGRYPNSDADNKGYLTYESHVGNHTIIDNELSGSPNWSGAEVVIRKTYWIIDRHIISSHSGTRLSFQPAEGSNYEPTDEFGYFIQGHLGTLDKFGEWFYDKNRSRMYVFFGNHNPSNFDVQMGISSFLVTNSSRINNLIFENLHFIGANQSAFSMVGGDELIIKNCLIESSGQNGITIAGTTGVVIDSNEIRNSNNNAIDLRSVPGATIKSNLLENTYMLPGMGVNGDGNGFAIYAPNDDNKIEFNEILNTGYIGIRFGGNNTVVKNNYINGFCLTKNDGGGIYTYTGPSNRVFSNRKVIGNIILNGKGVREGTNIRSALGRPQSEGIYLDDNSTGVEVSGNTIANVSSKGIYLHNARNNVIRDNVVYNSNFQLLFRNDHMGENIRSNVISGNVFFSRSAEQNNVNMTSIHDDIRSMASFDNNVYASPLSDNFRFLSRARMGSGHERSRNYDLESWRNAYNHDGNSKLHPIELPQFQLKGLIGDNKFNNEGFNSHANYISCNNCNTSWLANSQLDGGALRVTGSGTFETALDIGSVEKGKTYLLKFDALPNAPRNAKIYLRQVGSPWHTISAVNTVDFKTGRGNYELLFKPVATLQGARIVMRFESVPSTDIQIDNLKYYEANLELTNPDHKIFFEVNASRSEKQVSLPGEFIDMWGKTHTGSIKIPPYKSVLLIKTSEDDIMPEIPAPGIKVVAHEQTSAGNSGNIEVNVEVNGDKNWINTIELYNGNELLTTLNQSPYQYIWKYAPAGNHTLTAVAQNANGQKISSEPLALSVLAPNLPPIVSLEIQPNRKTFDQGTSLAFRAKAFDPDGEITKVSFYNGKEEPIEIIYQEPFQLNLTAERKGDFSVFAIAEDDAGAIAYSDTISYEVIESSQGINEPGPVDSNFKKFINLGSRNDVMYENELFIGDGNLSGLYSTSFTFLQKRASKDELFQTERNAQDYTLTIPVPNGTYTVRTYHNELWFGLDGPSESEGRRVFDIVIEGETQFPEFDIFKHSQNSQTILEFEDIKVWDGLLNLRFIASSNRASLSGLAIIGQGDSGNDAGRLPEKVGEEFVLHLNAGTNRSVEYGGNEFLGDLALPQYFNTSHVFSNNEVSAFDLYKTERNGEILEYSIPVPNGNYTIVSHHNELWFGHGGPSAQAGRRVFDISIEGILVKEKFDIYRFSKNQPTSLTFENIEVGDGVLNLSMRARSNRATLSGLSIISQNITNRGVDYSVFINTGGNNDTELNSTLFKSESTMTPFFGSNTFTFSNGSASSYELYQTERNGASVNYEVPVPNGNYTVYTFHNELWFGHNGPSARAGQRVFDIFVEGELIREKLDLYRLNNNRPTAIKFENVQVRDGVLSINMVASANRASVSGIAVIGEGTEQLISQSNLRGYREMGIGNFDDFLVISEKNLVRSTVNTRIYPNPARDKVKLEMPRETEPYLIQIHDLNGKLVQFFDPQSSHSNGNTTELDVSQLKNGVYLITVQDKNNIMLREKLVISK